MAFGGYLTVAQSQPLIEAAVASDLINVPRASLLAGLPPVFAASLAGFANAVDQFQSDLAKLNMVERLADGQVPIATFLGNAAFQLRLRSRDEARLFDQARAGIGSVASGVPPLPAPAGLTEVVTNEQIIGDDDSVDIGFLAGGIQMARAVAMIVVPRFENGTQVMLPNGGPWVLRGTAWIVAPGIAMTNHHVINARRSDEAAAGPGDLSLQAQGATIEFGFDAKDAATASATVSKLLASNATLDYALLEIAGAPDVPVPRLRSKLITVLPTSRMVVNIIQHPRGEPKQVALRNNLVTAADAETLRYFTDTDYGSSGSPVCDDQWQVVALHRGARHVDDTSYQGKTEAYVNFGSQIQAILGDIRNAAPTAATAIDAAQLPA